MSSGEGDQAAAAPRGAQPGGPAEPGSSRFNLSTLALRFPQVTLFALLVVAIAGTLAFMRLGQREDPDFTFRAMVIRTIWPGATTEQVDLQVTDRLERTLQEVPYFKWTRSYSRPGESLIVLELADTAPAKEVAQVWYQVRKKVGDIRRSLPPEVAGPFFKTSSATSSAPSTPSPATATRCRSSRGMRRRSARNSCGRRMSPRWN